MQLSRGYFICYSPTGGEGQNNSNPHSLPGTAEVHTLLSPKEATEDENKRDSHVPKNICTCEFGIRPDEKVIRVSYVVSELPHQDKPAKEILQALTNDFTTPSKAALSVEGIPDLSLYNALFGRDSITVAMFLRNQHPELARATAIKHAVLQGKSYDEISEEEPGKILHEYREPGDIIGEALKERGWKLPYYGTDDATIDWIRLLISCTKEEGAGFLQQKYTHHDGTEFSLEESLAAALGWLLRRLQEGFVISRRRNPNGIENPVWKDSGDSASHHDGRIVGSGSGKAFIEVQARAYDALLDIADYFDTLEDDLRRAQALELRVVASRLKEQIIGQLWVHDENYGDFCALGLEILQNGTAAPMAIRTSNMGHLLNSRLLDGEDPQITAYREAIIKAIFSRDMLNAAGVRTLSTREKRYRPEAYHNGTVWPWDTYYIAQGLHRQGYHRLAWQLEERLWWVFRRFGYIECASGKAADKPLLNRWKVIVSNHEGQENCIAQPPQWGQAWSVAAGYSIDLLVACPERIPDTIEGPKRAFEDDLLNDLYTRPEYLEFCREYQVSPEVTDIRQRAAHLSAYMETRSGMLMNSDSIEYARVYCISTCSGQEGHDCAERKRS